MSEEALRVAEESNRRAVPLRVPRACTLVPVDYAEQLISNDDDEDLGSKPKPKRGRPRKNPEGTNDTPKAKPVRPRKNPEEEEDQKTSDKPKAKLGIPPKIPKKKTRRRVLNRRLNREGLGKILR